MSFADKYGPWAVIAGASAGLGAEFARQLAARRLNLLLVARRAEALQELAQELAPTGVAVRTLALDLADADMLAALGRATADLEVGLVVYNAAASAIGRFLDQPLADHLRVVDVNCRGPVLLAHHFGKQMAGRGRGGILLMTSIAAGQGGPFISTYAASKAFDLILGEGLWFELQERGVDVLSCRAGATRTPGYEQSRPIGKQPPMMEAEPVVRAALEQLGRRPVVVPGWLNKLVVQTFGRVLPRALAVRVMGDATRRLYPDRS